MQGKGKEWGMEEEEEDRQREKEEEGEGRLCVEYPFVCLPLLSVCLVALSQSPSV